LSETVGKIIDFMNAIAPEVLAEKWDNVGLQVGSVASRVKRILLALDVDISVIEEAKKARVDIIISHHPLIRSDLKRIITDAGKGEVIAHAIRSNISIYSAHTNLDKAKGGVSDCLASSLDLVDVKALIPVTGYLYKIAVFVPIDSREKLKKAMGDAGGGAIGMYSHCSFETSGVGNFRPLRGSNPTLGRIGKTEEVSEVKLEVLTRKNDLKAVIDVMVNNHPYEEVAYDVYELSNEDREVGIGRIGRLKKKNDFKSFIEACKVAFGDNIRVAGDPRKIDRVAVCGGSGAGFIGEAMAAGADVFVTGDIKYHDAKEAIDRGFLIIDGTHDATETKVLNSLKKDLGREFKDIPIKISRVKTNPWRRDV